MMFFKGVLASLAGPAPNYDMQRVLATRNPREASLMSGMVNIALYFPRYMMIAGITVLALAFCMPDLKGMEKPDFEKLLPIVLTQHLPQGVAGLLLAGLLAAFMSNSAATINAAPAYIVNDIYRRFFNPDCQAKTQVALSRIASTGVLVTGILFGLLTTRITEVMMWIVGALYGGYVMANVLKWYWWRFNGYGYFWGMATGIVSAMLAPEVARIILGHPVTNALYLFPIIFVISVVGCILGTFLTPPEDEEVLKQFYRTVRPWGFWDPIRQKIMQEDPGFVSNNGFYRDSANVGVGIAWQLSLAVLPIYLVLHMWAWAMATFAVLLATSLVLKLNWYDKLDVS